MYYKKRMGHNIEPLGTPHLIFRNDEVQLFTDLVDCVQINCLLTIFALYF